MSNETKVKVPLLENVKYRGEFHRAGAEIEIHAGDVEMLINRGVVHREDIPEIPDEDVDKPLEKMTVPELKAYAAKHLIDFGAATKKEDILAAIQAVAGGTGHADQ